MKILILSRQSHSSRVEREHDQLKDIFKEYLGINLEITFRRDRKLLDKLEVENDGDIEEQSVYDLAPQGYEWVHVRLSNSDWRRLKLRGTLWGQHRTIKGVAITSGRWSNSIRFKRAHRFKHQIKNLHEHTLGMLHEFIHSKEGSMAIAHSFLYGYNRLYTKKDEKRIKPKRYVKKPDLVGALSYILNTNSLTKWLDQISSEVIGSTEPTAPSKYSPEFEKAVEEVLELEGGYVNHPSDPGGETKYGISKRAYPTLDIKNMTKELAKDIYYRDYWLPSSCDKMEYDIAFMVFDMSVNHGIRRSIRILQEALEVTVDGIIGPQTLGALNTADKDLPIEVSKIRMHFYQSLGTFSTFGKGWTNRVFDKLKIIY